MRDRVGFPCRGRRSAKSRTGGRASTRASSSGVGARLTRQPPPPPPPSPGPMLGPPDGSAVATIRAVPGVASASATRCQAPSVTPLDARCAAERLDAVADAPRPAPRRDPTAVSGTTALRSIELVVGALLDDAAVVEHDDAVGEVERRAAVGDEERRPVRHDLAQRIVDRLLGPGVDGAGGVVEDQDPRVAEIAPGPGRSAGAGRPRASAPARRRRCRSRAAGAR